MKKILEFLNESNTKRIFKFLNKSNMKRIFKFLIKRIEYETNI